MGFELFQNIDISSQLFVCFRGFAGTVETAFKVFDVGENEFQIDGFDITGGISWKKILLPWMPMKKRCSFQSLGWKSPGLIA